MRVKGKTVCHRNPAHVVRDAEMVLMFRDGKTLQEIGNKYGITRERVRQRLNSLGLDRLDGGQAFKSLRNARTKSALRAEEAAQKNAAHIAEWGLSIEEMRAISPFKRSDRRHPIMKFSMQRKTAKLREIEWKLLFSEWWRLWQESGKWDERGRGKDRYCMARWNDDGPYSVENCYITTVAENGRHYQDARRGGYRVGSPKVAIGVYCFYPRLAKPYFALLGGGKTGSFATVEEAISARAARGLKSPQPPSSPFGGSSPS